MDFNKSLCGALTFLLAGCNPIPPAPPIEPPNAPEIPYVPPTEQIDNPIPEPEPFPEPEPEPRGDLLVSIYTDTYQVGNRFEYAGRIQSSRLEDIMINNTDGMFEWRLLKQGKNFYKEKIEEDFEILFLSQGFMEVKYEDNKIKLRTSNTKITVDEKTYNVPHPIIANITQDADAYTFEEAGVYTLQLWAKYLYEDEWCDVLYRSEEFLVE